MTRWIRASTEQMKLNRIEFMAMNNPLRAWVQRQFEARRLLRLGGAQNGGNVLEVGCGNGVGIEIIISMFHAEHVDAFDLDERMVRLAQQRTSPYGEAVSIWLGDACAIGKADAFYDAVFDFGILHHIPDWHEAISEIHRVLKPGGRLYAEEVFRHFIQGFPWRHLLKHPMVDRFDAAEFAEALTDVGFNVTKSVILGKSFGWFIADKKVE